ncbi:MAG: glycerophosphodiester phosphodiesterase family protein [Planctomycetes bacterium]|nr:glycerophosphodiester phosphodiesterase family protein [Planctomycetota bacterium]
MPEPQSLSHLEWATGQETFHVPAVRSAEQFGRWQAQKRREFVRRFVFRYSGRVSVETGERRQRDGFTQRELWFLTDGQRLFRAFRLEPEKAVPSRPTIVAFMGHGKVAQLLDEPGSYQKALAAAFARDGYLVYAMENVGMGPEGDIHLDLDQAMRLYGWSWYSLLFAHLRMLLDAVFRDAGAQAERVGVTGGSTGGFLALAAAIEPRVAAASVHGFWGTMRELFIEDRARHCRCGAVTGLLPDFDLPTLAALIAPRPLHFCTAQGDRFRPKEAAQWTERLRPIWRALAPNSPHPAFTSPEGGHTYGLSDAQAFFAAALNHVAPSATDAKRACTGGPNLFGASPSADMACERGIPQQVGASGGHGTGGIANGSSGRKDAKTLGEPELIPHRGLAKLFPENTLPAFAAAAAAGMGAELDVYETSDGQVVVLHDPKVDRTTDGTGHVTKMSFAEVRALDAGRRFHPAFTAVQIPTLREALQTLRERSVRPTPIAIQMKQQHDSFVAKVAAIVREEGVADRAFLFAFESRDAKRVKDIVGDVLVVVAARKPEELASIALNPSADGAWLYFVPTAEQAGILHQAGKRIYISPLVPQNDQTYRCLFAANVTGVCTDHPFECRRVWAVELATRRTTNG